ncbi:MAG: toast rack family protein [Candidatus Promineifilaceae bacterium]
MRTNQSPGRVVNRLLPGNHKNPRLLRAIQTFSRLVTAIFIIALIWAIYRSLSSGNPLPLWAWLGILVLLAVAIGLGVAFLVYRGVDEEAGPFDVGLSDHITGMLKTETRKTETGGATALTIEITMAVGELHLLGGAQAAMEGSFTYDDADWNPPELSYSVNPAGLGSLIVKQSSTRRPAMRQGRCEWTIHLNENLPAELKVKLGAGKALLRPAGMLLTHLRVDSGVGKLVLDLSGEWQQSMETFVKSGIGDVVLVLPQTAGVRIQTAVELGSVYAHHLTWDGEAYTNSLYGGDTANLVITIEGGIGKLIVEGQAGGIL